MWPAIILVAVGATLVYEVFIKKHGPDYVVQMEPGKQKEIGGIKSGQVVLIRGPLTAGGAPDSDWRKPTVAWAPAGTEWVEQKSPGDPIHEIQLKYIKGDGIMEVMTANDVQTHFMSDIAAVEMQIGTPVTVKKPGINVPPPRKTMPKKK